MSTTVIQRCSRVMDSQDNAVMTAGHNTDMHYTHQHVFPCTRSFRKKHLRNEKLLNQGTGKKVTLKIRFSFLISLLLMYVRESGGREKGPCERQQGLEGDLQESICSSHYVVSGPELGSPGLSSKSFSLAERSHQTNYIRKFCIKYTILEKPVSCTQEFELLQL